MTNLTVDPAVSGASTPAPAPKVDLTDLADPTKVPSQSLSFSEFLSAINPLQHIPIVGTIYRAITGETLPPAARIIGGIIIGGPLGLVTSAADAILEQASGKDLGGHAMAMLGFGHDAPAPGPQYAANTAAASNPDAAPPPTAAPAPAPTTAPTTAAASAATPAKPPPATPLSSAPTMVAANVAVGPLSRAVLGGTATAAPPAGGLFASAVKPAAAGWSLADYRTFAGHGMPTAPNAVPIRNTPVPFQTTVPLASDVAHMATTPPVAPAVVTPAAASQAPAAASGSPASEDSWVAQAMMRGLDRYRDMKKLQNQGQRATPQVDATF